MNGPRKLYVKSFGCQMNVYDFASYGGHFGAAGLCRDRRRRRRRSRHPQYLPHPREGRREGLFRARPRPPHERGRRRRGPRASLSRSPAASRKPKARRSSAARPPSILSSARRAIIACPNSWRAPRASGKAVDTEFPARRQIRSPRRAEPARRRARAASAPSSRCRRAATSSAPSASCRTRAARKFRGRRKNRRRDRAAGGGRRARSHADRPERQRLSRRRTGRAAVVAGAAARRVGADRAASTGCATPPVIRATWMTI